LICKFRLFDLLMDMQMKRFFWGKKGGTFLPLAEFTSVIVHADADRLLDSAHDVVDIGRRRRCRSRLLLLTATSVDDHLETATGPVIVSVIQNGGRGQPSTTTSTTGVSMTTTTGIRRQGRWHGTSPAASSTGLPDPPSARSYLHSHTRLLSINNLFD
jgi:hypothetical protein